MNPDITLASLLRPVHRRQWLIAAAVPLPWIAAAIMVGPRWIGAGGAGAVAALLAATAIAFAVARLRVLDERWLARALDARVPQLEDSAGLLATRGEALTRLQALQRVRVGERLARVELPALQPRWPMRSLLASWLAAAAATGIALAFLPADGAVVGGPAIVAQSLERGPVTARIARARLTITPPGYTGLPPRVVDGLDATAAVGSILEWSLEVEPQPRDMRLALRNGEQLDLRSIGGNWGTRTTLSASMLYRVLAPDLPALDPRLHRVDATADRAPRVRVVAPSRTLNLATPGQRSLALAFEARDDYAIASARLLVTLAQGSGENIGVRTLTFPVAGSGPRAQRRYASSLDLVALGMQPGDDLIAQLHVEDNRAPQAQSARSASVILRWPPPAGAESSAMEGLVQRVLPAYFRSQRQIIIDSEALLKERGTLAGDVFVERSDGIGVDQRVLRLRYGQFLGEEAEDGNHAPGGGAPGTDASTEPREASLFADAHAHEEAEGRARPERDEADGHSGGADAEAAAPAASFGNASDVTAEFGHTHDIAEAATLLDPATQQLLRAALGEMWQAELHLRQGFPDRALPFEHRALDLIKQVQQADRIYLAKVGLEIPPVDESRRMTGKRDGLRDRRDTIERTRTVETSLRSLWRELGQPLGRAHGAALLSALADAEQDLLARPQSGAVLDVVAAIDAVRLDAGCEPCRRTLRARLWPLLPKPAANVRRRQADGATGRAYLDALAREAGP